MQELPAITRLSSILQWLVIVLIFVAGGLQILKLVIDKKIDNIREVVISSKIVEYQQTIGELKAQAEKKPGQMEVTVDQMPDRRLPKHMISQIKTELSKYEGSTVRLACDREDKEALAFAEELKTLFEESGWRVKGVSQTSFSKPVKDVVIILNHEQQKPKANYIFSLLMSLNLKSSARLNKSQGEDLGIIVGKKQ